MAEGSITVEQLRAAAQRLAATAQAASEELNSQDGKLGDGDLGITLSKGWTEVASEAESWPDDLGQSFLAMAKAFQRVSSSSFGTLIATGLMSAAKTTKGRSEASWAETAALLAGARDAMMMRGKGALGDKSVLDSLDAMARAAEDRDRPDDLFAAVAGAADDALAAYRDKPNKLGRARMFGDKSIGLDDPGMLAVKRLVDGLSV